VRSGEKLLKSLFSRDILGENAIEVLQSQPQDAEREVVTEEIE
jgi:hypothetical protein